MNNTQYILAYLILFLLIGLLSGTEVVILSLNKNQLKSLSSEGSKKAEKLLKILENTDVINFRIKVGLYILSVLFVTLAFIHYVFVITNVIDILYVVVISLIIYLIGILFPRRVALNNIEKFSLHFMIPAINISKIFIPIVLILDVIVFILLKITFQNTKNNTEHFCEDEVMSMLEVGQESGALKEEGKKMINSIFAFDDKLAYEVMTPRTDVFSIDIKDNPDEYTEKLMELRYSRIPVYEEDNDNIIGILNIKYYLIKAKETGFENIDIKSILRTPYFVPETKNIDSLFFALQSSKQHIAILIDEYGGFSSIVTMEDIIEEVMGDIDDEYDEEDSPVQKIDDNTFMVDGSIDLDDLNEELIIDLQSDNSETLSGFLIDMLGEIPEDGAYNDRILEYKNCVFKINSVKEKRIEYVTVHVVNHKNDENKSNTEC